ncbi:anti-sigma factor family protein [Williamsia sterculiae]|uniref:anti-sigma factor family protein n=1 Tax=Williamsia sterculiae TaxID=1344003 RepID=UPI00117C3D24|nr:zf-HC2 domain-containing protein [Williamsia sterculiae]
MNAVARQPTSDADDRSDRGDAGSTDDLRGRWSLQPAGSSITPNRGYRAPGTVGGRGFAPTDHLSTEAVAAYVDGELKMSAYLRAARHLQACPECAAAVDDQTAARNALRQSRDIAIPIGLLGQLSQIPTREIDMRPTATPSRSPFSVPGLPVHRRRHR